MRFLRRLLILVLFSSFVLLPVTLFASADTTTWLTQADPEFSLRKADVSDSNYPSTYTQRGNIDCDTLTFTARTGDLLPFLNVHKESQISGCFINTSVGLVDPSGYMNVSGTPYVANTVHTDNTPVKFFPFPNSDIFISNASQSPAVGTYVWFDHLMTSLTYAKDDFGRIRAVVQPQHQIPLTDKNNNLLPVMADNFSVSDNGQWAVVDSPGRGLLRINLVTTEVLPFTGSFEFGNGSGAAIRTAITSDGRYAAVASKSYTYFRIFDLSTCGSVPTTITSPVIGCQSRDLNVFARSKINSMGGVLQARFLNNNVLKFYASYDIATAPRIGEFIVASPGTTVASLDYVAMGDSFTSGEGSQKYEVGTDEQDLNLCHLSRVSYPYLLANSIQANSFHSVACSGATTINLVSGKGFDINKNNINRDNQYSTKPLNNSLGDWTPGYRKQISFIAENAPRLITVSAIGNDIGFSAILESCVKIGTCYPTYEDRIELMNQADAKLPTLISMLKKVKATALPSSTIYAIGYPQVGYTDGNCGVNVHLNKSELQLANDLITRINTVIKTAASQAGVNYADIEDALVGHRLCEADASDIAMNGLTAGKDKYGIIGNESFHPNAFGQFLMAQKILGSTNNLGAGTPMPTLATLPTINNDVPALALVPKTNRTINKRLIFTPNNPVVPVGQKFTAKLSGLAYALTPNSAFSVRLDGEANKILTAEPDGTLTIDLTIPNGTTSGIHSVDLLGTDSTSQPVDITSTFIALNPDSSTCVAVELSNQDTDKDSIDDACDPYIGAAPTEPNNDSATNNPVAAPLTPQPPTGSSDDDVITLTSDVTTSPTGEIRLLTEREKLESRVLGVSTDNPSPATPLKALASISKKSIRFRLPSHPLIYSTITILIVTSLITLGIQSHLGSMHKQIYKLIVRR